MALYGVGAKVGGSLPFAKAFFYGVAACQVISLVNGLPSQQSTLKRKTFWEKGCVLLVFFLVCFILPGFDIFVVNLAAS